MKNRAFHVVLFCILLTPILGLAGDSDSHFGYKYLSSYEDCLTLVKATVGNDYSEGNEPGATSKVPIPSLQFSEDFNGNEANTSLEFTPISKKLFQVGHVMIMKGKELDCLQKVGYFQNVLNQKYGKTKPKLVPATAKDNMMMQGWQDKNTVISLSAIYGFRDMPNMITITYANKAALALKDRELKTLERELSKDL